MSRITDGKYLTYKEELFLRHKDGWFIPNRKRVYLYWFKFLQEAEKSSKHTVDWNYYSSWGNATNFTSLKFDDWWEENWQVLFGSKQSKVLVTAQKYPIQKMSKRKFERVRLSYLAYSLRHTPINYVEDEVLRFHGRQTGKPNYHVNPYDPIERQPESKTNSLSIAYKLYQKESVKSRVSRVAHLNPDDPQNTKSGIQGEIVGLLEYAKNIMENVSVGQFP